MTNRAKKITNRQIAKTFRLTVAVTETRQEVQTLIAQWVGGTVDLNGEAKYVAGVLGGTDSTFGMQPTTRHFSGLELLVNKNLNGWTVKELPDGNGYSMYSIV